MVPHLVTALTGPINELEQRILDSMPAIERWFRLEWMEHTPPFYCSVDIRNAGFKLAPVDTNLFPGGWNNLTDDMLPLAVQAAMAAIEKICPEARNLLIIPENHTRNTHYLASVLQLKRIFSMAGLNVRIGSISPEIKKTLSITLPLGDEIKLEPVIRTKRRLGLSAFAKALAERTLTRYWWPLGEQQRIKLSLIQLYPSQLTAQLDSIAAFTPAMDGQTIPHEAIWAQQDDVRLDIQ